MDIGTPLGILLAIAVVVLAMIMAAGIGPYLDFASFLIVVMATIVIVIGMFPPQYLFSMLKAVPKAFVYTAQSQHELIDQLVGLAVKARREGILALEAEEENMKDELLRKGIRLAVDGTEPEVVRNILETDVENMKWRHDKVLDILNAFTDIAPAMGMIGTVVGLVAMLLNLNDPTAIGPAMAIALITTLYGSVFANFFAIPIGTRLKMRSTVEQMSRTIIIAGIMAIQGGDNPRIVEQKLNAVLPPTQRTSQFD
jgi:chemotaxis protein MotA